ncbi:WD40-repeat-containing domain protein [Zopfochytrium polystomum]|nr:WD40-repeat-containing domain protein [Zopfochytrium polystomum]
MEVHLHAFVPGTRQWLIDRLSSGLFTLDDSKKRMIWLKGPAGVGKSVMAALVAEHHKSKNQLAGVFFCKHDDERRRDIRQVILTIVHYLCVWDGDNYGQLIHAALRKTPDLVKKPVSDLFDELLRKPLGSLKKSNPRPLLIVVDALDECGTINERNEMLDLFGRRCRDLPPFVKIFMTSRLEPDIVDAFADMPQSALEPTDADNRRDLRIYAADFLEKQEVSEEVAKSGADRLVELSEGIFAWMVLACKSLEGSGHASISMRDIETLVFDSSSSGASMDSLLSSTFERIFSAPGLDESLLTTLIGMLCIGQELLSAADWAKLLGKDTAAVTSCVRHLQSLLVIENDPETDSPTIRFYHKSVADYLRDPVRCTVEILRMDSEKLCHYHGLLGLRCLRVMNRDLGFNILAMPLDVVASLASLPRSSIGKVPLALRYASTHVAIHLEAAESAIIPLGTDIISNVSSLASTHLTHWMEFLSICGRYESIIHSNLSLTALLTKLQVELGQEENVQASQLLEEGYKFSLLFRVPIIANPFQLYKSAMAACPKKSAFFRVYGHTTEAVACAKLEYMAGLKDKWSPAVATLEGHRRGINSLEVSRDSRRLLTRGNDKTVRLWETETGRELHVLAPFSSWVGAAVFSPNGKRVAVGSVEISIWDAMSGRQLLLLHGHKGQIRCLEYSADGSFLLSGCEGSSVRLWAAGTGEPIHVMEGHSGFIRCAKFAKDQQRIFSADANGLVIVWDVATGSLLKKLVGHTGGVRALDFSGDGKLLATASTDRTVRIWSTETYATLLVLEGHADAVRTVHFSSDGGRLVAGDQTVRVWDTTSGQCLFTQADHVGTIFCALFSPDGKLLVSGGSDRKIRVLNAKTGALIRMMTGHTGAVNDMAFFRSGRSLASGAGDTSARIWNLQGHHLRTLHDTDFVKILAFSQDGSMLAVGLANGVVKLYILPSGEPIAALSGHEAEIISAQFSRNGQQLASGDGSGKACLWDLETRNVVWTLPHSRTVTSVDFNADGTKLACSCFGNELRVWNTQTGQELHSLTPNAPKYAIFSADGAWMACISFGSGHRVYNVETGDFLRNPAGFPRDVSSMEFVGDGKLLIRDTKGRSFHWDFGSGEPPSSFLFLFLFFFFLWALFNKKKKKKKKKRRC